MKKCNGEAFPFLPISCLDSDRKNWGEILLINDWSNWTSGIIGGVVGGFLGCFGSIVGVIINDHIDRRKQKYAESARRRALAAALKTEIQTNWDRYMNTVGPYLRDLEDDKAADVIYHVQENYFPVYDNAGALLGEIENESLRDNIVKTVTRLKAHIDSFRLNTILLNEYKEAMRRAREEGILQSQITQVSQRTLLNRFAKQMKEEQKILITGVPELIGELGVYIAN